MYLDGLPLFCVLVFLLFCAFAAIVVIVDAIGKEQEWEKKEKNYCRRIENLWSDNARLRKEIIYYQLKTNEFEEGKQK